jgi:hypothetical protein
LLPINQSHVLCMISSCLSSPPHHPINHLTDITLPSRLKGTVAQDRSVFLAYMNTFGPNYRPTIFLGFKGFRIQRPSGGRANHILLVILEKFDCLENFLFKCVKYIIMLEIY